MEYYFSYRNDVSLYKYMAKRKHKSIALRRICISQNFVITHVESGEIKLSSEMEDKIERAKMQAKAGDVKRIIGKEAPADYLNNL